MEKDKTSAIMISDLRKRAEDLVHQRPEDVTKISGYDIQRLVHELQVHQIELEIQNEELRRAQSEIEVLLNKYFDLYELAPIGYFTLDRKGIIMEANLTGANLLGKQMNNLLKRGLSRFISRDYQDAFYFHLKGVLNTKIRQSCELELVREDGTRFHARLESISVEETEGDSRQLRTTIIDISDRKRAEEERKRFASQLLQAQKMEAVGTLAGGIAHDFNNLLQAVQGYAELLLLGKKSTDPGYRELQEIVSAAKRSEELTRQLLTFSRKVEGTKQSVHLNATIIEVKKLLERTIPKMIKIELRLAEKLNIARADPVQLEQVVMNLAVNAADAMPDGGRLIIETKNLTLDEESCRTHLDASPGDYLLLSVSDTGHGMDQETLEHIFEPFYTKKDIGQGTGLGLAIVYGIVKSHDGHINCYSEPGHGTTFEIYLPAMGKDFDFVETSPGEKRLVGGTETILLVDDEQFIRELGQQILTEFGYKVITAVSGEAALELYRKEAERIDLVILDLIMPGVGGKKCLEKLLRLNPQAKVLVATGFLPNEATMETVEAEAKGFISKPYEMRQILEAVREVLDGN